MRGTCRKFGDHVNTDEIIPARYLNTTDEATLAAHCMEDADAHFVERARRGDIIVAGKGFGCGSSREHAPIAIKAFGISCVVAESFARIFFRNAINIGLPIAECPAAALDAREGDDIEVDFERGKIVNHCQNRCYDFPAFGEEIRGIIQAGGLMPFLRKQLLEQGRT